MQHLRCILPTKLMLTKLKKPRLLKTSQSFMAHYCYQLICNELFSFVFQSLPATKLHTPDQGGMPLTAQKTWEMMEGCSPQKNKLKFAWDVPLFIVFLKLKADCFSECMQQWSKPVRPLLALLLRNFTSYAWFQWQLISCLGTSAPSL